MRWFLTNAGGSENTPPSSVTGKSMATQPKTSNKVVLCRLILICSLVCTVLHAWEWSLRTTHTSASSFPQEEKNHDQPVPAYHQNAPQTPVTPTLDPDQFEQAVVRNAYRLADKLKAVLYQQPCYCYCDRHHGHTSLLDCYTTKHTAGCTACLQELFYVHEGTTEGRTASQVREGIIRGDWKTVDLNKYAKAISQLQQLGDHGHQCASARGGPR